MIVRSNGQLHANLDSYSGGAGVNSLWTPGGTTIDSVELTPLPIEAKWTLIGFSIQGGLSFGITPGGSFAKLGKVIAGLVIPSIPGIINPGSAVSNPNGILNFPQDTTLTVPIWDPAIDPLPPSGVIGSPIGGLLTEPLNVSAELLLSNPIEILASMDIGIGVWMLPSLIGNYQDGSFTYEMIFGNSKIIPQTSQPNAIGVPNYTIIYDDGR